MIRKIFRGISILILLMPLVALSDTNATDNQTPEKVVSNFQKLPHNVMFCYDDSWNKKSPIEVGAKLGTYFSNELYKLFMWAQCRSSALPIFYADLDRLIFIDIRYGLARPTTRGVIFVDNFRVQKAKYLGADKAKVDFIFDVTDTDLNNIVTTYTLIRENGKWKIDDIAPHGDRPENSEQEPALEHSDSIKTDMLNNYRAADERYKQEQANKTK